MANPYHHALSSAKKFGGTADQFQKLHDWFDVSKSYHATFRHRALRHHAQGIFDCEAVFGHTLKITLESGKTKEIPTRWVAEQHVIEDMGFIPSFEDWIKGIPPQPWMTRARKLSKELDSPNSEDVPAATWESMSDEERRGQLAIVG